MTKESNDDYSTSTKVTQVPIIPIERAFKDGEDLRFSARSAVNYTGGRVQKVQAYLAKNLEVLSQMKNHVTNQLKGCAIDENLSLIVIKRGLLIQETHLQQCAKKKKRQQRQHDPPSKNCHCQTSMCRIWHRKLTIQQDCNILHHAKLATKGGVWYSRAWVEAWQRYSKRNENSADR